MGHGVLGTASRASNGDKPVVVTPILHVVHLTDRHCESRHGAQKL